MMTNSRKWIPRFTVFLAVLPLIVLAVIVSRYYVDVPYWDDWEIINFYNRFLNGQVHFADLFRLHAEHRPFFPRLITLAVAGATDLSLKAQVAVNLLIATGTFIFVCGTFLNIDVFKNTRVYLWLIPAVSVLAFSIRQWENWVWAMSVMLLTSMFASMGVIYFLSKEKILWRNLLCATAMALVANYSFCSGFMVWPAGFYLIALWSEDRPRGKLKALIFWTLIGSASVLFYMKGYYKPAHHPEVFHQFSKIGGFVRFLFYYLGSPVVATTTKAAAWAGFWGILTFLFFHLWIFKDSQLSFRQCRAMTALGLFAIGNAVLTAFGRVGFDPAYAFTSSRYVGISFPFWASLLSLCSYLLLAGKGSRKAVLKLGLSLGLCFAISLAAYASFRSFRHLRHHSELLSEAAGQIVALNNEELILRFAPTMESVVKGAEILKQRGWLAYSHS